MTSPEESGYISKTNSVVPLKDLSLEALLAVAEERARARYEGHLTILRFTTHWKAAFGTPDLTGEGQRQVDDLPVHPTLRDALTVLLLNDQCF